MNHGGPPTPWKARDEIEIVFDVPLILAVPNRSDEAGGVERCIEPFVLREIRHTKPAKLAFAHMATGKALSERVGREQHRERSHACGAHELAAGERQSDAHVGRAARCSASECMSGLTVRGGAVQVPRSFGPMTFMSGFASSKRMADT